MANPIVTVYAALHGETELSRDGRIEGSSDSPLTALGEAQAHELAAAFPCVSRILCAANRRSQRCAEILASDLQARFRLSEPVPVVADSDLREYGFGRWEGQALDDELRRAVRKLLWNLAPPPDGERGSDVEERFRLALRVLLSGVGDGTVVGLITSEVVLRYLYCDLLDDSVELAWKNALSATAPIVAKFWAVRSYDGSCPKLDLMSILSPGRPFTEGWLDADGAMVTFSTE